MSINNPKEIIKDKVEQVKDLLKKYEMITNRDESKQYEALLDDRFNQLEYEIKHEYKRSLPYRYISISHNYEKIKRKKQFLGFQCVRCSSRESMTFYTRTRKMQSRSQTVTYNRKRVTYQEFKTDFPVCGACRKKISRLKSIDFWTIFIFMGWIIGFGVFILYIAFNSDNAWELNTIYMIIAAVGALGILIGKLSLRFSKYWGRRFVKIRIKFLGYERRPFRKNYEGIPMVKPSNSKKWINYYTWLQSLSTHSESLFLKGDSTQKNRPNNFANQSNPRIKCPNCKKLNPSYSKFCKHCGFRTDL